MSDEVVLERALIATRRPLAARLITLFRDRGVETVAAFSEAEGEAPWLDDADFDAYLGDGPSEKVWSEPQRLVSAAMDAGCDVIHTGTEPVTDALDLWSAASAANVAVVGGEPRRMVEVLDRSRWAAHARHQGLPVLPISDPLGAAADGIAEAARIGLPLYVKALHGPWSRRVDTFDDLAEALAWVRERDANVVLERAADGTRRLGVVVVADQHGRVTRLATISNEGHGLRAVAGAGTTLPAAVAEVVEEGTCRLIRETGFVGVGRARWILTRDGSPWLLSFSPRLPTAFELVEAATGIDLLSLQLDVSLGRPAPASASARPAVQARCSATADGVVTRNQWGRGSVQVLAEPGTRVSAGEPLAVVTVAAEDASGAWSGLAEALAGASVGGVASDVSDLNERATSR
ncbi:MAG: hypothetical protein H6738_06735 [Alphaproteobacteria bacterium]|nr:hypothetical protein [Alphaproteobacteria bacterium]MCB9696458.1 hypothetical protein [Alphaproteobacteria bacterium]